MREEVRRDFRRSQEPCEAAPYSWSRVRVVAVVVFWLRRKHDYGMMTIVLLERRYEENGSRFLQDKLSRGHGRGSGKARDCRNHEARQAGGKARPSEHRDG